MKKKRFQFLTKFNKMARFKLNSVNVSKVNTMTFYIYILWPEEIVAVVILEQLTENKY